MGNRPVSPPPRPRRINVKGSNEANVGKQLVAAAGKGRVGLVASLLEQGAGVNSSKNKRGYTPLAAGCEGGSTEVVKLLIAHGADVNLRTEITKEDWFGTVTPLCLALLEGHEEVAALLKEHGADVNLRAEITERDVSYTVTPLCWALAEGHEEVAVLLIEHDADVHAVGMEGKVGEDTGSYTPLMVTAGQGLQHAAKLLLQRGAKVDKEAEWIVKGETVSATALMFAANVEVATLLLEHGAQINFQASRRGGTALMVASGNGHYEVTQLLLERGAAVDLQNSGGWSALMWAVKGYEDEDKCNDLNTIRVLIQHGANTNLRNSEGKTALDYAKRKGHTEVVELLSNPAAAAQAVQTHTENTACNDTPTESLNTEPPTTAAAASINDNTNKIHYLTRMFHSLTTRVRTLESEVASLKPQASNNPSQGRTKPELAKALSLLHALAYKWQNIGTLLGIDPGVLKAIKKKEGGEPTDCLREMLTEWLHRMTPPPTWQALAEAVRPYNQAKAHEIENIN